MDDSQGGAPTRRAALAIAASLPLAAQSGAKPAGNPVVHFEIGCRDRAKSEQFFGSLFGWKIQHGEASSDIDTGSKQGIPGHIISLGHEPQHYAMFYVEVDDPKAYLDKAVSLGGKILDRRSRLRRGRSRGSRILKETRSGC